MESCANISINLKEGSVSISGSEEFVANNMKLVFDFMLKNAKISEVQSESSSECTPETNDSEQTDGFEHEPVSNSDKYVDAGVYHIDAESGEISILQIVPGNSKAEKMKNIALIVLYIKKTKIQGKSLIPLFEKHACFDSGHFATIFKSEKTTMIYKGSGRNWTIELTKPGEKAATALLEGMMNGN